MCPKRWKLALATAVTAAALSASALAANVTTTAAVNVRSGPGTEYPVITVMRSGMTTAEYGETDGWTKVSANGKIGYVDSQYLTDAETDEVTASSSRKQSETSQAAADQEETSETTETAATTQDTAAALGEEIASYAKTLVGKGYSYGAAGPNSFDCSGLTMYVYANSGISIPRSSSGQYTGCTTKVSKSELQPGDLVFFSSRVGGTSVGHVGIYIGDGNMVHAANSSRGVVIDSINSTYYSQHYVGGGRYY